jgi:predicted GH43/DUF377 family glycosyl hydrolase
MKRFQQFGACIIITVACSSNLSGQIQWEKYEGNPVMDVGPPGSWDSRASGPTSVIHQEGIYKAWLFGVDDTGRGRIGYATSTDGLEWTKYAENPVLIPGEEGEWDDNNTDHACVLYIDSLYKMWYMGEDGTSSRIGYATSSDGMNWEKYSENPVLDLGPLASWDEREVMHPRVVFDGSTYHMWYNGYGQEVQRTGYASSPDGINWVKYAGNPVLSTGGPGTWDGFMLAIMGVIKADNEFKMWYTGGDGTEEDAKYFRIGYATSPDGINWSKHGGNPVLDIGEAGAWDSLGVVTSCVLFDSTLAQYQMWYGGLDGSYGRTGYATSVPVTGLEEGLDGWHPDQEMSLQNHPNPFHVCTTITYSLSGAGKVKLVVYDPLGNEIKLLVDKSQAGGLHSVAFPAEGLAGGIYFYTLQFDGIRVGSKKMLLIR